MNKYLLCILFCLFALAGIGQKANFKLAERYTDAKLSPLVATTEVSPVFINDSDKFWYRYTTGEGTRFYFVDPKKKIHRELFHREYVAGEIGKATGEVVNASNLRLFVKFKEGNDDVFSFEYGKVYFEYNLKTNKLVPFDSIPDTKKKSRPFDPSKIRVGTYSPDSTYIVYTKGHDVYLLSIADSVETRLTTDGVKGYSYALDDRGAKPTGTRVTWFADGQSFVVERTDNRNSKTTSFGIVDNLAKRPVSEGYEFAVPGEEITRRDELYFFRVDEKKPVKVAVDKWYNQTLQLLPGGGKDGVSKYVYFIRKRRTLEELDFCRVDSRTGEVHVVFNEVSKPYFNEDFFYVSFLNGGEDIIWWSERTGHGHLYRYDSGGNLKNAITSGDWTTGNVSRVDTARRMIYFTAYGQTKGESPYFAKVNRASIDGDGKVVMLTPEEATHNVTFSKSGRYFVDNYSRVDLKPTSVLRDDNGKLVAELASADLSRLYAAGWQMPEAFTVKAADGVTDLYGYMWKPVDFDSTKRYPIISYVYPGPQWDAVPRVFHLTGYFNMPLAQLGFVVVTFGHRGGTPVRERWYHTYGYGNLRDYALADDKYGIEQLADRFSFIDRERVGIFGHSGGGFMAATAIMTYPEFYKAAVSASGNHDNYIYNRWWGETHHGIKEVVTKEQVKMKSEKSGKDTTVTVEKSKFEFKVPTTMELVGNLKGHLMLVHGDADKNVHPAHTIRLADALLKAGKNFELVILPGQKHAYTGKQLDFFERKLWFHFAKYLLHDNSCDRFVEMDDYLRK